MISIKAMVAAMRQFHFTNGIHLIPAFKVLDASFAPAAGWQASIQLAKLTTLSTGAAIWDTFAVPMHTVLALLENL